MSVSRIRATRLVRVARLVDLLAATSEIALLPPARASALNNEITEIIDLLAGRPNAASRILARSLRRLAEALKASHGKRQSKPSRHAEGRVRRALRRIAVLVAASVAIATPFAAAAAVPTPVVGGLVYNPGTNANETVIEVLANGAVRTSLNNIIVVAQAVNDTFANPAGGEFTVTAVVLDSDGDVVSLTVEDGAGNPSTLGVVTAVTGGPSAPLGGTLTLPAGAGDSAYVSDVRRGNGGSGGDDGALFVSADSGDDGDAGPTFSRDVGSSGAAITTITAGLPGVIAASIGGDGGGGGDGYLGASGASGGRGGAGGNVDLTSRFGTISTTGDRAHGVVVQSRSGIGGEGGSGYLSPNGGAGGGGNSGGTARVTNYSDITTRGGAAHGVFAQSLGGGAGSGGGSYGLFGGGGAGNQGGDGGLAEAINYGDVVTLGEASYGVSAQSIGGIGGDAGNAVGIVTYSESGAPGGNGGTAIVRAQTGSSVSTSGGASYGLFAQSIGGGGGSGGLSIGLASLGSGGGTGGNGNAAQIFAQDGSSVSTTGISAHGLFAQSIGGGGGNGGISGGIVAFGSSGASGGSGGAVTVNSGASVFTTGAEARGIFAQSVGGGGGSAAGTGGIVALGGSGSTGGGAGAVTVETSAASSVSTRGLGADGIFAQSVGGGGGSGSTSGGVFAMGGSANSGGDGNTVIVTNAGSIDTLGLNARGIFAQSVGGGGGTGGSGYGLVSLGATGGPGSTGGLVTVTNTGAVSTAGNQANAIQAQSVGGGGGDGGTSGGVFLTIGGSGNSGGSSSLVTVNHGGSLFTSGDDANGLFAQSVGGGGGNGGSSGSISAFAGVAIGGAAGDGGVGGDVDINLSQTTALVSGTPQLVDPLIVTTGDRARGLFAQSVGGGGGNGGFAAQVTAGYGIAASAAVGGSGGLGGAGGTVNVGGDLTISTSGDYSEGLFAQSVGGGGGNGGFALSFAFAGGETAAASFSVALGGKGGSGGVGGIVDIDSGGQILTGGRFSTGLLAQSVGGGGGNGGFSVSVSGAAAGAASAAFAVGLGGQGGSGGNGGTADVNFDGAIQTAGDDARGAVIQAVGGGGGNGGWNVTGAMAFSGTASVGAGAGVGGTGGDGGIGGTAYGSIGGNVSTSGDRSSAVTVQSIGGGGGSGGFNITGAVGGGGVFGGGVAIGLGGAGGGGGAGGSATGRTGGAIQTLGDQSDGFLVQSVGGGGGSGGFNVAGAIGAGGTVGVGMAIGLGGSGGGGGVGATADGLANGAIQTFGNQSSAVIVQSLGGGGGAGGFNISGAIGGGGNVGAGLGIGLGGSGGGGGAGGSATGIAISTLQTTGNQSDGLLVQSVGGGGGAGAFNLTGSISGGGTVGAGASIGLGGSGGLGGAGGTVRGEARAAVVTTGDQSSGVIVQSLGGGGGAGGFNVSGSIAGGGDAGVGISVGLGGSGGGGGAGGEVDASVVSINTDGSQSGGFLAQSVGGGGGDGGFNVAGSFGAAGTAGFGISVGLGGSGGGGGTGGRVGATVVGDVTTRGADSDAIIAQSIGGGGGSGGFNVAGSVAGGGQGAGAISVGLGGSGGGGGTAGAVDLAVTGITGTAGANSDAILAQSVGGGGGNGGFNITGHIAASGSVAGTIGVGLGGAGGGGGNGGTVDLTVTGGQTAGVQVAALTEGDDARAIVAQSLGGGGGDGGFNVTGGIAASKDGAGNLGVGVGGGGGDGGSAAAVDATVTGLIQTKGKKSSGLLAQSVGGGGGNGGFNITGGIAGAKTASGNLMVGVGGFGGAGGDGGAVSGGLTGDVSTDGADAFGVTYQSLGGGGGNGAFNITGSVSLALNGGGTGNLGIGIGGFGGDGGNASTVDASVIGDLTTRGDRAHGALLQSVGGGGGNGGFNITGGISVASGFTGTVGFGLGGFGGGGGDAGAVTGVLNGDVRTFGNDAFGAMLQSLGGAGGNGGFNVTGSLALSVNNNAAVGIALGVGGFAGGGGSAGAVDGSVTGRFETSGTNADGVIAQSLGGGGGNGGINISGAVAVSMGTAGTGSIGIGGFGGDGGNSGTVNLVRVGDTLTDGANSDGVIAQSVAGGGGSGGLNVSGGLSASIKGSAGSLGFGLGGFGGDGGDADDVTADVTGNVWAKGVGSDVIVAEETVVGPFPGAFDDVTIPGYRVRADGSHGVLVQSVGGGGGSGGLNVSGGISITPASGSAQQARAVTLGVGGFGGGGGEAGEAHLTLGAPGADRVQVSAVGDNRYAVAVQSIGGGGGAGGMNISGGIATDGSLTAGVGGFGSAGGRGDIVTASVNADLFASGNGSRGFLVQSIGGGGGAGGINITGGISASPSNEEPSVSFGVGGFGGAGNSSGDVTASQIGQIVVEGVNAHGILVQSVAGGGGDGGLSVTANAQVGAAQQGNRSRGIAIGIGVGGTGGAGADAGDVTLDSRGNIFINTVSKPDGSFEGETYSGGSVGVLVQSIGGGGGVGGVNVTGVVAPRGQPAAMGVGGTGGDGGNAGTVEVTRGFEGATAAPGVIRTFGDDSDGLLAQSVGGGGGRAGVNAVFALTTNAPGNDPVAAIIAVGGSGAGAGSGADVSVNHNGEIWTSGRDSDGLIAQSIGGGGGDTALDLALGILSKNSVSITVGRNGGAGGESGDVSVTSVGTISTAGATSDAILAQSIGGGGGDSSATTVVASATSNAGTPQAEGYSASVSVGLDGGIAATAGDVMVDASGQISTKGDDSRGIFAQSIGGGGGRGGSAGAAIVRATGAATAAIGGQGGSGAISGDIDITSSATIVTEGANSDGILAQAIGGGGGLGGVARTLAFQVGGVPSGGTARTTSLNVGGTGGTGAVGGEVSVANSGIIGTKGDTAHGIRAQSIGGGGGVGGMVLNARAQYGASDSIDLNIGGSGGTGGAGGLVSVDNTGLIFTEGRDAAGISANSIGGGGGDAGLLLDAVVGYAGTDKQTHRFVANIGGSGGDGGTGGDVSVTNQPVTGVANSGQIVTRGDGAYGIFAQSLGGGGGNGSSVISLTGLVTGEDSMLMGLNVGGFGGTGNVAGDVSVTNGGLIDTTGEGAHGVLAQSIGGGGGNGGIAFAANLMLTASRQVLDHAPLVTVGGFGGDGGNGGDVVVNNAGRIVTRGAGANGIQAQSIGGGGGSAQLGFGLTTDVRSLAISSAVSALVGNFGGGSGGTGGTVTVNHTGDITVLGEGSKAIVAQSINGGGGTLTFDFDGITGLPGAPFIDLHGVTVTPNPLIEAQAGAAGATNMNAGSVTITGNGSYGVGGDNGVGDFAQAVGGGGGSLVMRATIVSPTAVTTYVPIPFDFELGGSDGTANRGGDITSSHNGNVVTTGLNSTGNLMQSIGGGGGLGLLQITTDDTVSAQSNGSRQQVGALGIITQAVPLMGPVDVTLGGVNGLNEAGGVINRTQQGAVTTTGNLSLGTVLQSIGGGGGSTSVILIGGGLSNDVNVGLGATGGSGLNGGDVTGVLSGATRTSGNYATGVLAQSIGAGGGEVRLSGVQQADVSLGGTAGASGNGGAVTLTNTGAIITSGNRSHGALLQSIGGGGGAVFGALSATTALNSSNVGDGSAVRFTQTGDVVTTGQGSFGIIAQSVGGGGGWIDGVFAGTAGGQGRGGTIDLAVKGNVLAVGNGSVGVFAQSLGSQGAGAITTAVQGLVRGGAGTGAGIRYIGGADNLITATGSISAVSGLAIDTGAGNDSVRNSGTVLGNIDLGLGNNAFRNLAGGAFVAFSTIDLRDAPAATGLFQNAGKFQMGLSAPLTPLDLAGGATFANLDANGDPTTNLLYGARVINHVALDGDFVQTTTGNLAFDVAFGPYASDRVDATGNATVAGSGDITLTWLENDDDVTLFATGGDGFDNGLKITDTIALDYSVKADTNGIRLGFVSDFGRSFLTTNEQAVGRSIDDALRVGGSGGIGRLSALLGNLAVGQEQTYEAIFSQINPEPLVTPLHNQLLAAGAFTDGLFGCDGQSFAGGRCVWARADHTELDHEGSRNSLAFRNDGGRFRAGLQTPLTGDWSLAGSVGYDRIDHFNVDTNRAHGDGSALHVGVGLQHADTGYGDAGVYIAAGWQSIDLERNVTVFESLVGQSSPESGYLKVGAEIGKTFRAGALFARPSLGGSLTLLRQNATTETGLGGQGFQSLEDTKTYGEFTPGLGVGVMLTENADTYASIGITVAGVFRSEDRIEMPLRFVGANSDAAPAVIGAAIDSTAVRAGVDFTVASSNGVSLSLNYDGEFGDTTTTHSAGFRLRARF